MKLQGRCTCVVGLQWGDEAKGKIVDLLGDEHDYVVRYNGGANAGHTVVRDGRTFKLSLLPTGILRREATAVIANGVVFYPPQFLEEVERLRQAGVFVAGNLLVSDRAHVIFPYHLELEALAEQGADQAIGTTGRGIGPCYADKAARVHAIRVGELLDEKHLRRRLEAVVPQKNQVLRALSPKACTFDVAPLFEEYRRYGEALRPYVVDTSEVLYEAYRGGKRILFEAAQGALLDVDHGSYPFVTSSSSSTAGVWSGSGLPARHLDRVVGVVKAYTTRVGGGPFPTELHDAVGQRIRHTGKEYGTVTGRPRRCGWFDAVAARYSARLCGVDELAVMLLDVLSDLEEIALATAYELDGEVVERFPASAAVLGRCQPVYERMPGWRSEIAHVRRRADLPPQARHFLDRISQLVGSPVSIISVGPDRTQTIME